MRRGRPPGNPSAYLDPPTWTSRLTGREDLSVSTGDPWQKPWRPPPSPEDTSCGGPARPVVCPVAARDRGALARAGRDRDRPLLHQRSRTAPRRATPVGTTQVPLRPGRQEILGTVNVVTLA